MPTPGTKRDDAWQHAHSIGYRLYDGDTDDEDRYQCYFSTVMARWGDDDNQVLSVRVLGDYEASYDDPSYDTLIHALDDARRESGDR
jgi:hypothetical protein